MTRKDYPRICANCKYFDEWTDEVKEFSGYRFDGTCRRYPDTFNKELKDWCGEFAIVREPKVYEVIND